MHRCCKDIQRRPFSSCLLKPPSCLNPEHALIARYARRVFQPLDAIGDRLSITAQADALLIEPFVVQARAFNDVQEIVMAKKTKKIIRREYTKPDVKELRAHSKAKTPVAKIVKLMKRTEGSLRQKAHALGIPLGHSR